jgi:hypothetical protein
VPGTENPGESAEFAGGLDELLDLAAGLLSCTLSDAT